MLRNIVKSTRILYIDDGVAMPARIPAHFLYLVEDEGDESAKTMEIKKKIICPSKEMTDIE